LNTYNISAIILVFQTKGPFKVKDYSGLIINTHTHIYPEKIASKATEAIGRFYDIPMNKVGTEEMLTEEMTSHGIRHAFLLSTATVPQQVRHINDFLIDVLARHGQDRFTAFGTVHPHMEDPEAELDYIKSNGIMGIKFHHDFLGMAADDPAFDRIYAKAQADKIPVYVHAGDSRYEYTNPRQLLNIHEKFPDLILIAAHIGGYSIWEEAAKKLKETNFYFDTSSALFALEPQKATQLIRGLGVDRFFFATDFPMWDFPSEWARFSSLGLTDDEFDKVVHLNAEAFLRSLGKDIDIAE